MSQYAHASRAAIDLILGRHTKVENYGLRACSEDRATPGDLLIQHIVNSPGKEHLLPLPSCESCAAKVKQALADVDIPKKA